MNDKSYEAEFMNGDKCKLKSFIDGFISYLKEKSISKTMNGLFTDLELELFIWRNKSENDVSDSLSDKFEPIQIKSGGIRQIKIDEEGDLENEIKSYIEKAEKSGYIFSSAYKVRYNESGMFVSENCIMWGIVTDAIKRASEKFMAEVLLDFLQSCFDSLDCLSTKDVSVWKEKEKKYNFDIIDAYVKKVFCKLPIPAEDVIKKISYQHYEGSEVCAEMYFVNEDVCKMLKEQKKHGLVWIDGKNNYIIDMNQNNEKNNDDNDNDNNINNDNTSIARKMLEICKNGNVLLVRTGTEAKHPIVIVAVADKGILCGEKLQCILKFCGRGEWRLCVGEDEVLEYGEGVYNINKRHFEANIKAKVEEIPLIENTSLFEKVFNCLNGCAHGALMIVGDTKTIKGEVKRLSRLRKGTKIEKLNLSEECNLDFVQGLASVDGAIMVDYRGMCYGFGIILDGKTRIEGDVGRGSRYNSAKNYATWRNVYAVVFSEDKEKGIGVIPGNQSK